MKNVRISLLIVGAVILCLLIAGYAAAKANRVVAEWYFKEGYPNYAPNGIPDFDMKQDGMYGLSWPRTTSRRWA